MQLSTNFKLFPFSYPFIPHTSPTLPHLPRFSVIAYFSPPATHTSTRFVHSYPSHPHPITLSKTCPFVLNTFKSLCQDLASHSRGDEIESKPISCHFNPWKLSCTHSKHLEFRLTSKVYLKFKKPFT